MHKRKLLLLMVLLFVLTACSFTSDNTKSTTGTSTSNNCISKEMNLSRDNRVEAQISDKNDTFKIIIKDTYTIEELKGLAYGATYKDTEDGYYATYELCNLSDMKIVDAADLSKDISTYNINTTLDDYGAYADSSTGSTTDFAYTTESEEEMSVESGNRYSLNVYIAKDDDDWIWADSLEFEVE